MKSVQEILNLCYDPANKRLNTDVSVHAADLAAHTYNIGQLLRTGEYFFGVPARSASTLTPTVDFISASPIWIARNLTADRIAIEVTTAVAGGMLRLGIYNAGTNLYPGTLLLDAGEVDGSTTGVKSITISQALTKGLYWGAVIPNSSTLVVRAWTTSYPLLGVTATGFSTTYVEWYKSQAYGALPDPFPADGTQYSIGANVVLLRLLSLD